MGVIRVESELARYFLQKPRDFYQFCAFNLESKTFYSVSDQQIVDKLSVLTDNDRSLDCPNKTVDTKQGKQPSRSASKSFATAKYLDLAKNLVIKMSIISANSKELARKSLLRVLSAANAIKSKLVHSQSRETEEEKYIPPTPLFKGGDVYISVGLDWDDMDINSPLSLRQDIGMKVLLCCYDLIPIVLPGTVTSNKLANYFPEYIKSFAKCADMVMCISRNTQHDLQRFLQESCLPCPRSEVFHLGTDLSGRKILGIPPSEEVLDLIDSGPYILFVSTIERRKGHDTLYRAYTRLLQQKIADLPTLVFVGMPGWGVQDLLNDIQSTERVAKAIKMMNHVSDADLSILYENCLFTVYPSIYEGWGLPVSESLAYGKFCLASNTSSIPEAGGEFCEYLDPWDVPKWTERLAHYFSNPSEIILREDLIRRKYVPHTWAEAAHKIVESAQRMQVTINSVPVHAI